MSALAPPMAVVISGGALARGGRWRGGAPGKTGPPRPAPPRVGSGVVGGVVVVVGSVVVVGGVVAVMVCVVRCFRVLPGGSPAPLPPAARSAFGAVGRPLRLKARRAGRPGETPGHPEGKTRVESRRKVSNLVKSSLML